MARQAALKREARRIRDAVRSYAQVRGWPTGNFETFVRRRGGGWHLLVVSDELRGKPGFQEWFSLSQHLEQALRDDPSLFLKLHFSVRSAEQVAEGGLYAIPDDYVKVDPRGTRSSSVTSLETTPAAGPHHDIDGL